MIFEINNIRLQGCIHLILCIFCYYSKWFDDALNNRPMQPTLNNNTTKNNVEALVTLQMQQYNG